MYAVEITNLLVRNLETFTTQNVYQLAGHTANLHFWVDEVKHCFGVLEGYSERFEKLKSAQMAHVAKAGTYSFDLDDEYEGSAESMAPPKRAIKDNELKELRRSLCDATYAFLVRCYRQDLIDERCFVQSLEQLGLSVDPADRREASRDDARRL